MIKNIYQLFRNNLPYIVTSEEACFKLLGNSKNKIFQRYDYKEILIGCSVVRGNTILLLCVDSKYRHQGIGAGLLLDSEAYVLASGYHKIKIGAGEEYLMPGIPMRSKPFEQHLGKENIYPEVTDDAVCFFTNRGYYHSWKQSNCFDMRMKLSEADFTGFEVGSCLDGILYRFATLRDIPSIMKCLEKAEKGFCSFYQDEKLYQSPKEKVLIATCKDDVCGTLIIGIEAEEKGLGSIGCTAVSPAYRGKHIGANIARIGTGYIKRQGLNESYLSYTFSGLDKMYGYSGYEICVYFNMAVKNL